MLTALGLGSNAYSGTGNIYDSLHDNIIYTMIIVSAALLPGYLAAFLVIDCWGRKPLQFMGFIMLTILFLIMGVFCRLPPLPD